MIKIAITGNIASGKSCIEKYLIKKGYQVIDADKLCHEIIEQDNEVIKEIKNIFEDYDIFDENLKISRIKLGNIVFNNSKKMKQLENILYKELSRKITLFWDKHQNEKFTFVSAAMLFESGFYKDFHKIIFVSASEEIRLNRLITRNNLTPEQAKNRISLQDREEDKIKKSDFVIKNDSDIQSVYIEVDKILYELTNQS